MLKKMIIIIQVTKWGTSNNIKTITKTIADRQHLSVVTSSIKFQKMFFQLANVNLALLIEVCFHQLVEEKRNHLVEENVKENTDLTIL